MSINAVSLFLFGSSWAGVAMQSLAMLVVLAWLILHFRNSDNWRELALMPLRAPLIRWSCVLGLSWLVWNLISSQANPTTAGRPPAFIGGYLWWAIAPWTASVFMNAWTAQSAGEKAVWTSRFGRLLLWTSVIVCLIALSQWFWGWKIHGTKIIESEPRARVLFSHPLSLAYIVLLYTPLALFFLLQLERLRVAMIGTAACGVLLFTSASRTVQVVSMLVAAVWCLFFLRGKMRVALIATGLVGVSVLALTENPVRARFQNTIGQIEDRQQDKYADDRLAFWAAHWEMFKERPVMGHGNSYTQEYLSPYYARIGLADFEKKYQAHNMFLQVLVNTGIVGALIWSTRLLMLFFAASKLLRRKLPGERSFGWAGLATVFAVLLAGITQNAFQDSAVRFHWAILEGLLLWKAVSQGKKSSKFILAANKESTP